METQTEEQNTYQKEYYKQNKAQIRAYQKEYYKQNKEYFKDYYAKNKVEISKKNKIKYATRTGKTIIQPVEEPVVIHNITPSTPQQDKFEILFQESKSKLFNIAYGVVGNKEIAEDVLQDAYIKAWREFENYDPNKKFVNWMTTIVRNTGIDANRTRSRHYNTFSIDNISSQLSGDKNQITTLDVVDKSADLFDIVEKKELMHEISILINGLPKDLKDVMQPFFEGQSYEEISDLMKLNMSTVRARVHRAKKILRKSSKIEAYATF